MKDKIKGSIVGSILGDIVGVPYEFTSKNLITKEDILSFKGYKSHNVPFGYWSDDSSLILATMDSLKNGRCDYKDIGTNFCHWLFDKQYTPQNQVFDCGTTIRRAINQINECDYTGRCEDYECGNGSLMRILPVVLYQYFNEKDQSIALDTIIEIGNITHSNKLCEIGIIIYSKYVFNLLDGKDKLEAYKDMQQFVKERFKGFDVSAYNRILNENIFNATKDEVNGSGFIVNTLESVLWTFINSNNYKDGIINAILLGNDTDTVASITGGLLGLYYGYDNISSEWIDKIFKKDYIFNIYNKYELALKIQNNL